jgi:hypothetical protein
MNVPMKKPAEHEVTERSIGKVVLGTSRALPLARLVPPQRN